MNQTDVNTALWTRPQMVRHYRHRRLRPAERLILGRHREALTGRVLELGCGAGRLTRHLVAGAQDLTGIDISEHMVALCRRLFPRGTFVLGDLRDVAGLAPGPWDAVVAGFNVVDVLDDADRARLLDDVHAILASHGLLIMSSHNLACAGLIPAPTHNLSANPVRLANRLVRLPRALHNRRRLIAMQRSGDDYAILNDVAHDYAVLHYYITRDAQERQFATHRFELLECLELDGKPVPRGGSGGGCHELHYVARRLPVDPVGSAEAQLSRGSAPRTDTSSGPS